MTAARQTPARLLNSRVIARAERTANNAISDLLSRDQRCGAVVVPAPAGAGKSHLVSTAVGRARDLGLRVAVAASTNEQVFGLVRTISQLHCSRRPGESVVFVPASGRALPGAVAILPGVLEMKASETRSEPLVVATLDKFGDAFGRSALGPFDVLLIDESYQADSARYFAVAGLAPVHLLVGDSGQISPFSTIADPCRWRGLPEDPLQTAIGVLLRNHPETAVYPMPITRRLDPRAAAVARFFYPTLTFDAAVLPGVRQLRLRPAGSAGVLDHALDLAACAGWAHVELPATPVLQADPETIDLIVLLVRRLFARRPQIKCERWRTSAELRAKQVAVGVSHNDQKDLLRAALDEHGLDAVTVETANKLQGLEFEVVFVWHPLAGLPEPDGFHLDPGRLCVLLTRHRHACVVIGRAGDPAMLKDQVPPTTPAYLGWDPDPVLDGWEVHGQVFGALEAVRLST